jgi:hypothetical protein
MGPPGDTPQPDPIQKLTEYVESLEISLEIQEDKTDVIEDQVANLTEQITELKQQVQDLRTYAICSVLMSWRALRNSEGLANLNEMSKRIIINAKIAS